MPIVDSTMISVRTTRSSMRVKPRSFISPNSPFPVFRAIQRLAIERRVDVEHVLAAPARRIGLVLVRAHAPFVAPRHRIGGNAAQESQLPPGRVVRGGDA